jgi:DNA invertase Pin-like site-specific DNA recombinase
VRTIMHLQRLASCGVSFHSYTEPHLAADNELVRGTLIALPSSLAKVEAQTISDRTKAGMARAKAERSRMGEVLPRQQVAPCPPVRPRQAANGETAYPTDLPLVRISARTASFS